MTPHRGRFAPSPTGRLHLGNLRSALLGFNAYAEGWGLYSEQLADEMGFYANDRLGRLGCLQSAAFRASRLVVDTGMHHKRWTREQAIASMVAVFCAAILASGFKWMVRKKEQVAARAERANLYENIMLLWGEKLMVYREALSLAASAALRSANGEWVATPAPLPDEPPQPASSSCF